LKVQKVLDELCGTAGNPVQGRKDEV
jgi:hypothetical protein